jgi:transcriptional regulator with XRE-family HTH domain
MNKDLDEIVLELLAARKGDWQALADAADVSHSWLSKFFNGHIPNPGFATLKRLHEQLVKDATHQPEGVA